MKAKKSESKTPEIPAGLLEMVVFTSGAVVMIYELAGARMTAPYLGTSSYVWTAIIGIILGSLSLGYYLGGRWADKDTKLVNLSYVLLAAGVLVAMTGWLSDWMQGVIAGSTWPIEMRTTTVSLVLFAPAAVMFGMVSPYAIRLKLKSLSDSGEQVGKLYAISTFGSIVGTFAAGFVLIPAMGTERLILSLAVVLVMLSGLVNMSTMKTKWWGVGVLLVLVGLRWSSVVRGQENIVDVDTGYSRVQIKYMWDSIQDREVVVLSTGVDWVQSAMYPGTDQLVLDYAQLMKAYEVYHSEPDNVLVIGGAAYSLPRYLVGEHPETEVTVVEIDPGMTEIAREYFELEDNERMEIIHEDGRIFLNQNERQFDVVMMDAFGGAYSIPFQMVTREAMVGMGDALSEDGVLVANVIGAPAGEKSEFMRRVQATMEKVFGEVTLIMSEPENPEKVQNVIFVATKEKVGFGELAGVEEYVERLWTGEVGEVPILTDDYAPVEYLARQMYY